VVLANLDPTLEPQAPPEDAGSLLEYFDFGLTPQEVAALLTDGNDRPDRRAAETAMVALVYEAGPAPCPGRRCVVDACRRGRERSPSDRRQRGQQHLTRPLDGRLRRGDRDDQVISVLDAPSSGGSCVRR